MLTERSWSSITDIALNLITHNGLSAFIKLALSIAMPIVDEVVVCDTGSVDGTLEYLKSLKEVKLIYEDVQPLGETWTNSPKDVRLTELLNEMKEKTDSDWIIKIDDDEVFPHELLREIVKMKKESPIYSVPFIHVGQSSKLHYIKRLFHNIPEVRWEGIYGTETLTYNYKRLSSKKCPKLNNFFIHLGELRPNHDDRSHRYENL